MTKCMTRNKEISRVPRSREQARIAYNKLSRWYDVIAGFFEKEPRELALQKLNVAEGEKVLEIGFGTGHSILALARSVNESGRVYGIDISDSMVDITEQRIAEAGLSERVDLKRGDATQLPFETEIFNAVFMSFTLELFDTPEISIVLKECRRVLQKGGRICIVTLSKEKAGLITKIYEWLHNKLPRYADCRPIFVQRALDKAGFQIIDSKGITIGGLFIEIAVAKQT